MILTLIWRPLYHSLGFRELVFGNLRCENCWSANFRNHDGRIDWSELLIQLLEQREELSDQLLPMGQPVNL